MLIFPVAQLIVCWMLAAVGCAITQSSPELSALPPTQRPRWCQARPPISSKPSKAPDRPLLEATKLKMLSCHKTPAAGHQCVCRPNRNQNSVFRALSVASFDQTNEFFVLKITQRPVALLTSRWPAELTAESEQSRLKYSRDLTLWKTDRLVCVTPPDLTGRPERQRKDG